MPVCASCSQETPEDPAAQQPLAEARALFASMGYKPAHAQADALLAESQPAAS